MGHELLTRLISSLREWGKRDSASPDQRRGLRAVPAPIADRLESPEETLLEMARRHVRQGERHVTRQAQIYEELLAAGMNVERAEALLATHLEFLRVAREHLKNEEIRAAGCTQDVLRQDSRVTWGAPADFLRSVKDRLSMKRLRSRPEWRRSRPQ